MSELPKLVYVDDESDIREVTEFALEDDFDLQIFPCAQDFLDASEDLNPDIILLDVMMPEMDGPTLYEEIKKIEHLKHLPTLFMTAKVQPDEILSLMSLGAKGIISKPFEPIELPDQIKFYLD